MRTTTPICLQKRLREEPASQRSVVTAALAAFATLTAFTTFVVAAPVVALSTVAAIVIAATAVAVIMIVAPFMALTAVAITFAAVIVVAAPLSVRIDIVVSRQIVLDRRQDQILRFVVDLMVQVVDFRIGASFARRRTNPKHVLAVQWRPDAI